MVAAMEKGMTTNNIAEDRIRTDKLNLLLI
jgi:hypothetical protein